MTLSTTAWHTIPGDEVLKALGSEPDGLDETEARTRLPRAGANSMPSAPPTPAYMILLRQFRSVVVALLVGAAVVALSTGDGGDATAIGAVLAINIGLGFGVEMRARRAVEALGRLEPRPATVLRGGRPCEIDARDTVPGDVLLVEAGQSIAADARLLLGHDLRIVEAPLTGESAPVSKHVAVLDAGAPLPERRNMLYAGTTVATGTGRAVVVATGSSTELGAIGRLVTGTEEQKSPLERRLDVLGRQLVWVALIVGVVMATIGAAQGAAARARATPAFGRISRSRHGDLHRQDGHPHRGRDDRDRAVDGREHDRRERRRLLARR